MADSEDSRSILSFSSVTSRALKSTANTSPDRSALDNDLESTPNKNGVPEIKNPNSAKDSPFISPTHTEGKFSKRRKSTLTPPPRKSKSPTTRRSSYSPLNTSGASPNNTVVDVLESASPDESHV